jgi:hypothetical protein
MHLAEPARCPSRRGSAPISRSPPSESNRKPPDYKLLECRRSGVATPDLRCSEMPCDPRRIAEVRDTLWLLPKGVVEVAWPFLLPAKQDRCRRWCGDLHLSWRAFAPRVAACLDLSARCPATRTARSARRRSRRACHRRNAGAAGAGPPRCAGDTKRSAKRGPEVLAQPAQPGRSGSCPRAPIRGACRAHSCQEGRPATPASVSSRAPGARPTSRLTGV